MTEQVRIERIASGGDGVGRLADGRVVFVPRTAPGDLAEVRIVERRASFARGVADAIVEPSAARVAPRCAHYTADDCGGCVLQHLSYDAQLAVKASFVADALARIGKVAAPDVAVVPNPRQYGWRTRLSLSIDPRTAAAGLRRLGRPDEVFGLRSCEIATDAVRSLWDALRARPSGLPPRCERVTLREARDGRLHVIAHGSEEWPRAAQTSAALAAAGVPATLWVEPEGGAARVAAAATGAVAASRAEPVTATIFEQVDPAMGDAVRDAVLRLLGDVRGLRAWDLYAGIGETSVRLALAGATVESVEADPHAVDEAVRRGPASVRRHAARVEEVLDRLAPADLVVANPPRSGLGPKVTDALAACSARRAVYVSCDPATLARDVARLAPRWRIEVLCAFDSFPQTAHVETVALLTARGPGGLRESQTS
jgi:23S rRNA (uracil1939-C5)-methyltransferase